MFHVLLWFIRFSLFFATRCCCFTFVNKLLGPKTVQLRPKTSWTTEQIEKTALKCNYNNYIRSTVSSKQSPFWLANGSRAVPAPCETHAYEFCTSRCSLTVAIPGKSLYIENEPSHNLQWLVAEVPSLTPPGGLYAGENPVELFALTNQHRRHKAEQIALWLVETGSRPLLFHGNDAHVL